MDNEGKRGPGETAKRSSPYAKVAKYLALGIEFPATIGGALVLGYFLDIQLGTEPWLMVVAAVLGFFGATFRLIQYSRYFSDTRK